MNETTAYIEKIRLINPQYQYLELAIQDESFLNLKPGESLLVRFLDPDDNTIERWDPYLRDQWWPAGFTKDGLLLVERPFTHRYRPQQAISIMGPVGQPYRFRKSLRNVLLVAYDTPPFPLTIMIAQLLHNNISVTLVLIGEAQNYQTAHLSPEVEVIHGNDNLEWADQVMTLGWADQMFVVVKQDDEVVPLLHNSCGECVNYGMMCRKIISSGYFSLLLPCACRGMWCMYDSDRKRSWWHPARKGPTFDLTQSKFARGRCIEYE